MYICYLNDKFYGTGSKEYMNELFKDYVVSCDMYGKYDCEFRIVRVTNENMKKELLNKINVGDVVRYLPNGNKYYVGKIENNEIYLLDDDGMFLVTIEEIIK